MAKKASFGFILRYQKLIAHRGYYIFDALTETKIHLL